MKKIYRVVETEIGFRQVVAKTNIKRLKSGNFIKDEWNNNKKIKINECETDLIKIEDQLDSDSIDGATSIYYSAEKDKYLIEHVSYTEHCYSLCWWAKEKECCYEFNKKSQDRFEEWLRDQEKEFIKFLELANGENWTVEDDGTATNLCDDTFTLKKAVEIELENIYGTADFFKMEELEYIKEFAEDFDIDYGTKFRRFIQKAIKEYKYYLDVE